MDGHGMDGHVAIVSGGGRGLGRSHCLELARQNVSVLVNDFENERADEVVREIEELGGRAAASYDTVATPDGAASIVRRAVEEFGSLDIVVNNAGFMRNAMFEDQTFTMLNEVLAVHILGSFFLTQAAWPIMREKNYGRIIMTSSSGGLFAMQGESNYAAAKAGVYGLMKALAFEGKPHGIYVNAVLPHAATLITVNDPVPGLYEYHREGLSEAMLPRRITEAVAPLVAFLASPICQVTGEAFAAGCGRFARVFVGVAKGWVAPDAHNISVDDIAEHLDDIRSVEDYEIPDNLYEEIEMMARAIGWQPQ